jgi:hypothetical protein
VLSRRSIAVAYGAMALGLAADALIARAWLDENARNA